MPGNGMEVLPTRAKATVVNTVPISVTVIISFSKKSWYGIGD